MKNNEDTKSNHSDRIVKLLVCLKRPVINKSSYAKYTNRINEIRLEAERINQQNLVIIYGQDNDINVEAKKNM